MSSSSRNKETDATRGPYFDDLFHGQVFDAAPSVTLNIGHAMVHQAIVGDRLRLPLDDRLATAVTGRAPLAHPALVWDVAIGQSTLATQHAIANLFYRGLALRWHPCIGDTLRTTTEVVALRQNRPKTDRRATGMAVLRIKTVDQRNCPVLDFWRCAMLPLRDDIDTGQNDDIATVGNNVDPTSAIGAFSDWRLDRFRGEVAGDHFDRDLAGTRVAVRGGDVVSGAPELARLTLNIAQVHHDATIAGSQRLVYGGHTIATALGQVARVLPNLVTVVGWHSCDHTGPVREGDTLYSRIHIERADPSIQGNGGLVHVRSRTTARTAPGDPQRDVLDWRFVALMA